MAVTAVRVDAVWSVAVLCFLVSLLSAVGIANGSLMYVLIMEEFGCSREAASWPGSVISIVAHVAGFAVTLLELRFSLYQVTLMGATLLWVGLLVSGFARSCAWISVSLGVIHGAGAGIVFLALSVYVAAYFDKYRAIASGLKFGGWAAAGLIFPPAFTALLNTYGFIGVFILCSAICMHATPLIMLFKNPPIITLRQERKQRPLACQVKGATPPSKYCFADENILQQEGSLPENQTAIKNRNADLKQRKAVVAATETKFVSTEDIDGRCQYESEAMSKQPPKHSPTAILDGRRSFWNVCGPFRKAIFYAFAPAFICCDYSELASQITIVDYAIDKGWSLEDATSLMMCISVGSLLGRLLLPLLADFGLFSRSALMSACYTGFAAVFLAMPHVSSFHGVILLCVVSGATVGCAMTLKPVLMADYLGADQIAPTMGITGIIMLPLIIGNPSIVGFFRDKMGSYDNYYRLLGGINLFVALTLLAIVVHEIRKKRANVTFA